MKMNKGEKTSNISKNKPIEENDYLSSNISVVLCVKNSAGTVEKLLQSLERSSIKEIVIVDGMSDDGTLEICRKYTDIILSDDGKGLGYARQIGAETATGDIIVYIDADVYIPTPDIFKKMFDEMIENDWVAINTQILDPRERKKIWEEAQDIYYQKTFNFSGERCYLLGMVCMIRRYIVLRYAFDPSFTFGSEDTDFFHRLGEEGLKFGVSTHTAYHFHRSSLKDFARQKIGYGMGDMKFIMKHGTYKSLTTPAYIFITGLARSIMVKRPSHIVFYMFWSVFLGIGMLKGLFIRCRESLFQNKNHTIPLTGK